MANLILGDVAVLAALGRSPVVCALADMQRLVAAASAAAAPQRAAQPSPTAAAPPDSAVGAAPAVMPQQQAQVQQPARSSGTKSQGRQQRAKPGSGGVGGSGGGKAEQQLRRRLLRLAGMHLSGFLLPWANEQAADVFADVAQAAADQWQLWRCVSPNACSATSPLQSHTYVAC